MKMSMRKIIVTLFLLAVFLAGCASRAEDAVSGSVMPVSAPQAVEMEMAVEESAADMGFRNDAAYNQTSIASQDTAGVQERIIIRTADMSIVVVDTEDAMNTISQMVEENGGWVVSSSVYQYDENAKTGNMSVRVPSEGFDPFLDAVGLLSVEVTRISTSGQDVTEEYVDVSARLDNLEATADRVRSFLDEAKTVEEALAVNRELSNLEGEIEAMKGRLQYLEQSAAFSNVTIDLTPDVLSQPIEVGGWQPQGVARSAVESLIDAMQTLVDIGIWLIIFVLPVVLVVGIPIWLVIRFIRRRRAARHGEGTFTADDADDADGADGAETTDTADSADSV
jgi:hypothetical protein